MSAEILRQAATLMRERAEAVPAGPWEHGECDPSTQAEARVLGQFSVIFGESKVLAPVPGFSKQRRAFAEYAASWHPAVALAVADWLEAAAGRMPDDCACDECLGYEPEALTVARAYLGEVS